MDDAVEYARGIWSTRYFWAHLAISDLRSRWRGSVMGLLWSILQPLGMTLLVAVVLGKIFNQPIYSYAPYILSGILVWEFVTSTLIGGSLAFVQADAYIRQCRHPLAIYTLRTALTNLLVLMLASLGLVLWVLVAFPGNLGLCWLALLTLYPVVGLAGWAGATVLAYIGVRFRDIPHALGLVLQTLWFVSPIYFDASVFRSSGLVALVDYNPIYHVVQLARAPLLEGMWPTPANYIYALGLVLVLATAACVAGWRSERKVIFYL
jgi:lipopolysaccharide transport system permease protein